MEELGQRLVVQPAASATKLASIGSPSCTRSSSRKSGPRDSSSKESDIPREPKHQKLKHLVTELGSLVDSLTQDSASLESEKADKELWKKMYRELKRKRGEDKILALEHDLHAKKLKIKNLKEKLEEKSEVNELEDFNKVLITEREEACQDFNMREREKALKKIHELERNLDGKQKLEMEIEEFKRKLEVMKRTRDDEVAALQQKIHLLDEQLQQNIEEMDGLKHLNQQLIAKESQSSHELQEVHKDILDDLSGYLHCPPINIGIKWMGKIDEFAFKNAFKSSFSSDKTWIKDLELLSLWQERIEDPDWQPFRIGEDEKGNPKELLKEDDEELQGLKDQWGDEIYKLVTSALIELHEYNPRRDVGRDVVRVLWNIDKNQKATLKEAIHYISTQW